MTFRIDQSHIHNGRIGIDVPLDLFTHSQPDHAIAQRDAALAHHAAVNGKEFGERSRAFILAHLRTHGPTSGEALVIACKAAGIVPVKDDRAFGGSFLSLSKRGLIVKAGECKRTRGHATAGGIVWMLKFNGYELVKPNTGDTSFMFR